jgi:hypothetical protein
VQDGNTALVCAAAKRHSRCVSLLLDDGAHKETKNAVRVMIMIVISPLDFEFEFSPRRGSCFDLYHTA